jgi:hypothetical protein
VSHRLRDANPYFDFATCECDVNPGASVAIDEFGYFAVRNHENDFSRLIALDRLGGQGCLCLRALRIYRGLGPYWTNLSLSLAWASSRSLLLGLRLRRHLPKLDMELFRDYSLCPDWLANALLTRGWSAEVKRGDVSDIPSVDIGSGPSRKPVFARCVWRSRAPQLICRVLTKSGLTTEYTLDHRLRGHMFVGIEAALLANGFKRLDE